MVQLILGTDCACLLRSH